jgi:hypothetical protein
MSHHVGFWTRKGIKMTKLSEKQRGEVTDLLDGYQKICDLLSDIRRPKFLLYIMSMSDENDTAEVQVRASSAKLLLESEKAWTIDKLKNLGIEV